MYQKILKNSMGYSLKSAILPPMEIFTTNRQNLVNLAGSALTIGNFDGVHLGHRALLDELKSRAGSEEKITVVTFSPHPTEVLRPESEFCPLFDREDLKAQLKEQGVEALYLLPFTTELSELSARKFFDQVLLPLNPKKIVVGSDFGFGKNRQGDVKKLSEFCAQEGIEFLPFSKTQKQGEDISSSRIRKKLGEGDVITASGLLGRPYYVTGEVQKGQSRGKKLGWSTANLYFQERKLCLARGVYFSQVSMEGQCFPAITNVGINPTFNSEGLQSGTLAIESHILKGKPDCYGKKIQVEFLKRCRSEKKFDSVEELQSQVGQDISQAKEYFNL